MVCGNTHHSVYIEDNVHLFVDAIGLRNGRHRLRTYVYAMMKFAVFASVAAAACVVVVCGQPTTEGDERCDSPDVDLENVAKQTTLTGVAKVLNEVKESTLTNNAQVLNEVRSVKTAVANLNPRNPNCETPSQINLNANPVVLLRGKTGLNTYLLTYYRQKV